MLRLVDGVPHVILGPLLLTLLAPLERFTGASRRQLALILVPFTGYGLVVVAATHDPGAATPQWLIPVALTANTAALVVGAAAMTRRGLTPLGRSAGAGLAAGGVLMLLALRRDDDAAVPVSSD